MTLKELLGKVDFESLAPFIEKTEGNILTASMGTGRHTISSSI